MMTAIRIKGGRLVDPMNVTRADVEATDFIHAISCINRYTGHAKYPYSVGQHTYVLALSVPKRLTRAALIHDYAEAYFNDMSSPIKSIMPIYEEAELTALRTIAEYYTVDWSDILEVSQFDKRLYKDETDILFGVSTTRGMGDERVPLGVHKCHLRERNWYGVRSDLREFTESVFNVG